MSLSPTFHQLDDFGLSDYGMENTIYADDVSKLEWTDLSNCSSSSTVTNDQFIGGQDFDWRQPATWSQGEVRNWLLEVRNTNCYLQIDPEKFAGVDGAMLVNMPLSDFVARDPICGEYLYFQLQPFLQYINAPSPLDDFINNEVDVRPPERVDSVAELMKWYKIDGTEKLASLQLPSISTFSQGVVQMEQPPVVKDEVNFKNEPESPPPSPTESVSSNGSRANPKNKKKGKLWEFMRDLLLNPQHNPNIIKWEDRTTGVFRIVRSEKVAELWGIRKCNSTMTYEKLSRALRYYYKKGILERIDGRRLVYKFGPNSKGWQL